MIPGSDCHDYRYRYPRKITFCEPKYAVSVARAYNKKRAMSEALGGAGWNCTLEEMKRGINTLAAMGTSMFVLHGFYYECDHQGSQSDWPASFFYQNEYWKDFKIFADYMRRISFMNTAGRAVVKYGIFYPIEWMSECMVNGQESEEGMEGSQAFHEVLNEMIEQQMDVDMIDSHCILNAGIQNGALCVGQQQIRLLLYPSGAGMDRELEEKLREWQAAGGKIILYETGTTAKQIQSFPANKRCQPCEAAEAAKELTEPDIRIIWGCRDEIYVNHRQAAGCHYFFICNSSKEKRDLVMELDVNEAERVYRLNIETGDSTVLPFMEARSRREEGRKEENGRKKGRVRVVLEASEAIYLFCTDEEIPDAETMPEDCSYEEIHITGKWDFLPLKADAQTGILEVPLTYFSTDLREGGQEIWIRDWESHDGKRSDRASQWEAFWITRRPSWNDQLDAENLYFYKDIVIQGSIQKARICLAAIDSYKLYINGCLAAERRSEGMPDTIDVKKYLKPGENRIAVSVKNHHPMQEVNICSAKELPVDRLISLLLQGEIVTEEEEQILISDSSWAVTDQYTEGWNRRDVCHEVYQYDILKVNNFNHTSAGHSWIKAWERGRPPLLPWGDLPLFGQDTPYPYYKYYETELPAGVRRIQKPDLSGESQCFLDGVLFDWSKGWREVKEQNKRHVLTIKVLARTENDGLERPVAVVMAERSKDLTDWQLDGLTWYSGTCRYQNTFWMDSVNENYLLDLGAVNYCAEIWINGKPAGSRIWPPYRWEITQYLKEGENILEVQVSNLAGNERRYLLVEEGQALGWNRYWNRDNMERDASGFTSGLLGPVRLLKRKRKENGYNEFSNKR